MGYNQMKLSLILFLFCKTFSFLRMSGEKIEVGSNYITTSSDNVQESGVYIPGLSSRKEPIKLKISYYPSWIKGNEKIRINSMRRFF
jgi:hypothetical protein